MNEPERDELYDVRDPRWVLYRTKWNVFQNAVYWIDLKSDQDSGLIFWQTNSDAIILNESVPAPTAWKRWNIAILEKSCILYQKVRSSPRPPLRITLQVLDKPRHWSTEETRRGSVGDHAKHRIQDFKASYKKSLTRQKKRESGENCGKSSCKQLFAIRTKEALVC